MVHKYREILSIRNAIFSLCETSKDFSKKKIKKDLILAEKSRFYVFVGSKSVPLD